MQGRRVRDATSKERHVAHAGETVSRQVLKNRRRSLLHPPTPSAPRRASRGNTLRSFLRRERRRCWCIVRRNRKVNVGQAPR